MPEKRLLPSVADIKKVIGSGWDRFVALLTGVAAPLPNYTTVQRNAISTSKLKPGDMIFNSSTMSVEYWTGEEWSTLASE